MNDALADFIQASAGFLFPIRFQDRIDGLMEIHGETVDQLNRLLLGQPAGFFDDLVYRRCHGGSGHYSGADSTFARAVPAVASFSANLALMVSMCSTATM